MNCIGTYSTFEALPEKASQLFEEAGAQSFFQSLHWYRVFMNHALEADDRVQVYSAVADILGQSRAVLPLLIRAGGTRFWKIRKLVSLASYYTPLFGPVWGTDANLQAVSDLARCVVQQTPSWDVLELRPLDPGSPAFAALVEGFEASGFVVQTYFCFGNWYLPVNGQSFEQYLESRPSNLRNTLHRKSKKLERSGRAKIEIVTGGPGLEEAIAAYHRVYVSSWKREEAYPEFISALIRTCAELGSLRLGLVYVDGQPVAAQFWIVHNGVASIYKLAYDERFPEFSAGTILTAKLMQHVLDVDYVREIDYLSGDDAYKRDWMSHRRERWGILAMNPHTLRGGLAIVRHVAGRALKRAFLTLAGRSPGSTSPIMGAFKTLPSRCKEGD